MKTFNSMKLFLKNTGFRSGKFILTTRHSPLVSRYLPLASCLLLLATGFFSSCKQLDVYEKDTAIPKNEWQAAFEAKGSFDIADTLSPYNIYVTLRHTDAYKYNNIWLNIGMQSPGDSIVYQKINLHLGSDATGWEGKGMNDIWDVKKLVNPAPWRFKKRGIYNFNIMQIMRDDPLLHVMSVGLRIEKQAGD